MVRTLTARPSVPPLSSDDLARFVVDAGKMTQDQFLRKYQEYITTSPDDAKWEADMANQRGIVDDKAVAVDFGVIGWTVMLESGYNYIKKLGLVG